MKTDETTPPTPDIMKHYVVGFLFDLTSRLVVLILKNRPVQQAGLLNGPGGKMEHGELPMEAMIREFREEVGLEVNHWEQFCTLTGKDHTWRVNFFRAWASEEQCNQQLPIPPTDEPTAWVELDYLFACPPGAISVANLHWLLRMALDREITATVVENCADGVFKRHLQRFIAPTPISNPESALNFCAKVAECIPLEDRDPSKPFPTCDEVNDLFKESLIACPVCGHREKISFSGPCPQCSQAVFCKED